MSQAALLTCKKILDLFEAEIDRDVDVHVQRAWHVLYIREPLMSGNYETNRVHDPDNYEQVVF